MSPAIRKSSVGVFFRNSACDAYGCTDRGWVSVTLSSAVLNPAGRQHLHLRRLKIQILTNIYIQRLCIRVRFSVSCQIHSVYLYECFSHKTCYYHTNLFSSLGSFSPLQQCLEYVCLSGFMTVLSESCNLWDRCGGMQYICMHVRIYFQLLPISWLTRVIITSPKTPAILRETVDTKAQLTLKRSSFVSLRMVIGEVQFAENTYVLTYV